MEYALIEFCSGEVEIVARSTLRDFDHTASLPRECICDWKSAAKKKSKSYAAKVAYFAWEVRTIDRASTYWISLPYRIINWIRCPCSIVLGIRYRPPIPGVRHSHGRALGLGLGLRLRLRLRLGGPWEWRTPAMADRNRAYTLFCWHYPTLAPPPELYTVVGIICRPSAAQNTASNSNQWKWFKVIFVCRNIKCGNGL